nr:hypothetical protein [uncultured Desulfobacter sp.]
MGIGIGAVLGIQGVKVTSGRVCVLPVRSVAWALFCAVTDNIRPFRSYP